MVRKFRTQPWYLMYYMLGWAVALGALSVWWWSPPETAAAGLLALMIALVISTRFDAMLAASVPAVMLSPDPAATLFLLALLLPLTWPLGILCAVFIHNASHDQFRPRWLNPVLGELVGWSQRTNLLGWKMVHHYHHKHADDPVMDPHCPGSMAFWPYANWMQRASMRYLDTRHKELHGMPDWFYGIAGGLALIGFALMPLSWYLLLGPTWFAALWMPTLCSCWWLFTVINYQTHPPGADGRNRAVDLYMRPWQRLVNRIGFGVLYHASHHRNARLFNPAQGLGVPEGGS
ncbi:MAG: fatty acid desaturase [Pseudomonadales bacterium]|nr:fatty acid desaturase [Pseudomonadales bacterium]